jgi:hypothetical protein
MGRKRRGERWSMQNDRQLIQLAKTQTLDELSATFKRPPELILKWATRLGLKINRKTEGK